MLEFMSCGRPLVAGLEGESAELIKNADAGICVTPENATALAEAIRFIYRNPDKAQQFADSGREYVVRNLSRESTAQRYLALLKRVSESVKVGGAFQSPSPTANAVHPTLPDNTAQPIGKEVQKAQ
jgi:glycosyltransferase involved in cell wall biosynthesis